MRLKKNIESRLLKIISSAFDGGKKNWNYPHTRATVYWMRRLIKAEGGDEKILVTAMYLHDLGYAGLCRSDYKLADRLKVKKKHMIIGAERAWAICGELGYTARQIKEISHLVAVHDNKKSLKTKNEKMVLEADTLGMLDYKRAPTTLSQKDYLSFINGDAIERISLMKSRTARINTSRLYQRAVEYGNNLK